MSEQEIEDLEKEMHALVPDLEKVMELRTSAARILAVLNKQIKASKEKEKWFGRDTPEPTANNC